MLKEAGAPKNAYLNIKDAAEAIQKLEELHIKFKKSKQLDKDLGLSKNDKKVGRCRQIINFLKRKFFGPKSERKNKLRLKNREKYV